MDKAGPAVQVTGAMDYVSRTGVKQAMSFFGQVVHVHKPPACGDPDEDAAIVRFATDESAEAAVKALKAGFVFIDGTQVSGDFHSGKIKPTAPPKNHPAALTNKAGSDGERGMRALVGGADFGRAEGSGGRRDPPALGDGEKETRSTSLALQDERGGAPKGGKGGHLAVRGRQDDRTVYHQRNKRFDQQSESLRDLVLGGSGDRSRSRGRERQRSRNLRDDSRDANRGYYRGRDDSRDRGYTRGRGLRERESAYEPPARRPSTRALPSMRDFLDEPQPRRSSRMGFAREEPRERRRRFKEANVRKHHEDDSADEKCEQDGYEVLS